MKKLIFPVIWAICYCLFGIYMQENKIIELPVAWSFYGTAMTTIYFIGIDIFNKRK